MPVTEIENSEILAAMQGMVDRAPEPGTLNVRDVVHQGDSEYPAPIVVNTVSSAGYVYIYDTLTGQRSQTNINMLPAQLKKKRADGTLAFSLRQPIGRDGKPLEPTQGTHKCMLHTADPQRELYDQWGLGTCQKANLRSPTEVKTHMEHRHSKEWKTIEGARLEAERQEDRALQRELAQQQRELLNLSKGKANKAT